ncbi:MAG: hypothetical protein ABIR02_09730 [Novosphingobium sp.]
MAEERVTTYETPAGTNTTVIHEGPPRRGSGMGWLFGIVLLIAVLAVVYLMAVRGDSQSAKDNAIANAATEVGTAAKKVGSAAENAANNLEQK